MLVQSQHAFLLTAFVRQKTLNIVLSSISALPPSSSANTNSSQLLIQDRKKARAVQPLPEALDDHALPSLPAPASQLQRGQSSFLLFRKDWMQTILIHNLQVRI